MVPQLTGAAYSSPTAARAWVAVAGGRQLISVWAELVCAATPWSGGPCSGGRLGGRPSLKKYPHALLWFGMNDLSRAGCDTDDVMITTINLEGYMWLTIHRRLAMR